MQVISLEEIKESTADPVSSVKIFGKICVFM